jgi:hypothetical protein
MSAYECYQHYNALKLHFTKPTYDYFKYNHKSKVSTTSFDSRKDKIFFMKVAKHKDPVRYMLSNILVNPKLWIRDIAYSAEAEKVYSDWQKRQQSLTYLFKQELSKLKPNFDSNFKSDDHTHPYVLKLYLQQEISLETLVILVDLVKCSNYWSRKYEYDPIVEEVLTKIMKYRPFLQYDRSAVKKIVIDYFNDKGYTK